MLADIEAGKRKHNQSTFGPEEEEHVCRTAMCTAGHLVQMGGHAGWLLKQKLGFSGAASLIHAKAHPNYPQQNFGEIGDKLAMGYIRFMAGVETKETA